MTLEQILTIMLYSLRPHLWLLVLALGALVVSLVIGRRRRGPRSGLVLPVSLLAGVAGALLAPTLTGSRLAYVATPVDWLALVGVGIGVAIYSFLLLAPLWRR